MYSVEDPSDVPDKVDRKQVRRLRNRYREANLQSLGDDLPSGNFAHGGWTQLVGTTYERRIYAFRFDTTPAQDDALIARMNAGPNRSHFNLLFNNCADLSRMVLNSYFPRTFSRSIFPDAGVTTPKQMAYKLVRYASKHPCLLYTSLRPDRVAGNYRDRPNTELKRYSGFDSALYRNVDSKWHFPQENATSHDIQMATRESKPL